jgi:TPR repeat protein
MLAVLAPWLIAPRVAAAQVEPSAEVQAALGRQKERSQRRERGLDAFQGELRPLAEAGDPVAQFLIGTMLVGRDPVTAIPYLTRSAEHGCAGAAGLLAVYSWSSGKGGGEWLERAVSGGDAASMFVRATLHMRGDRGFEQSTAEALAWAELARARSYSSGLTPEIERMIGALRSAATADDAAAAAARLEALDNHYPRKPFYVCGQSVPSEG